MHADARGHPPQRAPNFDGNSARRLLNQDSSVQIKKDIRVVSHGEAVWEGQPVLIGINGIALSTDGSTLYWTVTTGNTLHASPRQAHKLKGVRSSGKGSQSVQWTD
ncbi:hypothetical protein [Phyllobacterium zundukense]|uniref:Uncharacterized protein n=1 Tax=Phyllobacterium zundukense TaxID=1867719 RepID=A0A2N9VY65_9HYPH|nr:hypothetical protein [Phyllobacterium zundukense]ATU94724.1 hypothetical protein BLM14_23445 [Phyllobacterium zundukense]PIO44433.1 hypothetical protein B5P45_13000 [Phyllobacterium zundukense]